MRKRYGRPVPYARFPAAQVVESATAAMQVSTAVALLTGSAGLTDKLDDGDAARWLHRRSYAPLGRLGLRRRRRAASGAAVAAMFAHTAVGPS